MTFWCGFGSGSADPCLWLMDPDPDPDPAIFVIDLQAANQKHIFYKVFLLIIFWRYICTFTAFFKDKKSWSSHKTVGIKVFLTRVAWRSIPLTSGSGSGRPKNMWIRWIRIRFRNTGILYIPQSDSSTTALAGNGLYDWYHYRICQSFKLGLQPGLEPGSPLGLQPGLQAG